MLAWGCKWLVYSLILFSHHIGKQFDLPPDSPEPSDLEVAIDAAISRGTPWTLKQLITEIRRFEGEHIVPGSLSTDFYVLKGSDRTYTAGQFIDIVAQVYAGHRNRNAITNAGGKLRNRIMDIIDRERSSPSLSEQERAAFLRRAELLNR